MVKRLGIAAVVVAVALGCGVASAKTRDRTAPSVELNTPSVIVSAPAGPTYFTAVSGWASDRSGIRDVDVFACTGSQIQGGWMCTQVLVVGSFQSKDATLSCAGTRCDWHARLDMLEPGKYLVFATATDRAGNRGSDGPANVIVI